MCWSNTESYVICFWHTHSLRDLLFIFVSRMFLHIILICSHCLFHSIIKYSYTRLLNILWHVSINTLQHVHTLSYIYLHILTIDYSDIQSSMCSSCSLSWISTSIFNICITHILDPLLSLITFYFWVQAGYPIPGNYKKIKMQTKKLDNIFLIIDNLSNNDENSNCFNM